MLYPDYEVFLRSAKVLDKYKLTFADCQIVSQGLVAGIRKIGSFDRDFARRFRRSRGLRVSDWPHGNGSFFSLLKR